MRNRWEEARLRGGGVNEEGGAGERDGERECEREREERMRVGSGETKHK